MLLLIAECNFTKKNFFYCKRFPINLPKFSTNKTLQQLILQGLPDFFQQNIIPNGQTMSNPRRFDVDITSIRRRPNFGEFPRHFRVLFLCNFDDRKIRVVSAYSFRSNFNGRKIDVVSTYSFRCNFDGRKIYFVSTYFYWCNFAGQKIHVVSTYFFQCDFDVRKIYVVSTYFLRCNLSGRNMHVVFTYFFQRDFGGKKIRHFGTI